MVEFPTHNGGIAPDSNADCAVVGHHAVLDSHGGRPRASRAERGNAGTIVDQLDVIQYAGADREV